MDGSRFFEASSFPSASAGKMNGNFLANTFFMACECRFGYLGVRLGYAVLTGVGLGIVCPFRLKIMVIYAAITITCRRGHRVLILDILVGCTNIRWTRLIGPIRKTIAIYRSDSRPVVAIVVVCIVVIWILIIWVECMGYVASRPGMQTTGTYSH